MKKILLTLLLIGMFLSNDNLHAQRGWSYGDYYQTRGDSWVDYTYRTEYNYYTNTYVNVRYCRRTIWRKTWRSGYINYWYWNGYTYTWQRRWYEGYSWYYVWGNWYRC